MHFYNFNIGDYRKDTTHLSPIEHYIYRTLIDWYYLDEAPIENNNQSVSRRLGIGKDMVSELENVLKDFFVLEENRWVHRRIESEISTYKEKLETNRKNGKLGGRPVQKPKNNPTVSERQPNQKATKNQEPITNNQETLKNITALSADTDKPEIEKVESKKAADDTPYQDIIALYHEICVDLPACKQLTDSRKSQMRQRWNSQNSAGEYNRRNLDWWRKFFTVVAQSDFLCGRSESGWRVNSFDWLINATNFLKICEGAYNNTKGGR